MHPNKLQSILNMDGEARFSYFVRKAADAQEIWSLFDDGWATAADNEGNRALPFWPEQEFARACATGAWSSYQPRKIEIARFVEKWLPGMQADGVKAAVFPTPADKGVVVDPSMLQSELERELGQYE